MDRLIFHSCGVTNLPLVPLLAARYTLVLPAREKAELLCRKGARAIGWETFADPERARELPAAAARLARRWHEHLAPLGDGFFAFGGRPHGAEFLAALADVLPTRLERQLVVGEYMQTLAATGRLDAVVQHEDVTGAARMVLEAVRPYGVPSLHLPHGLYTDDHVVGARLHEGAHSDLIAVAGPGQRDWFLRRGVAPNRIVVTGNPAWDGLPGVARTSGAVLGLAPGPVVTVATSWIGDDVAHRRVVGRQHDRLTLAALGAVALVRARVPGLRLVLKLHPSAPEGEEARLRAMAAEADVAVDLVVTERSLAVLTASDALVTLPSTLAVEALLVGTPVVSPEFRYDGDAVLTVPGTADAMAGALLHVLDGWGRSDDFAARRRDFMAWHNGPCDGHAAERAVAAIEMLAAHARARRATPSGASAGALRRECVEPARRLLAADAPATALVLLDAVPADSGLCAEVWTLRGEAHRQLGRADEAEGCLRHAIAERGGAAAHTALGLLLLERNARAEADACLRQATQLDPCADAAWCGLGVLAVLAGDVTTGILLLERARAINPENPDARRTLALLREDAEERA